MKSIVVPSESDLMTHFFLSYIIYHCGAASSPFLPLVVPLSHSHTRPLASRPAHSDKTVGIVFDVLIAPLRLVSTEDVSVHLATCSKFFP